jgi:hypothetical protein
MLSCTGLHENGITDHISCNSAGEAEGAFSGHEVFLSENAASWNLIAVPIRSP